MDVAEGAGVREDTVDAAETFRDKNLLHLQVLKVVGHVIFSLLTYFNTKQYKVLLQMNILVKEVPIEGL